MNDTYDLAKHYYHDFAPPLWDKSRLEALVKAGRLSQEEMESIINDNHD